MKRFKLAGIGCGGRTRTYLSLAAKMPEYFEIVGAADPIALRVEQVRTEVKNPAFRSFKDANELLSVDKFADILVIGTQDAFHFAPCLAALQKGYDILLEKPISNNLREVLALEKAARELGRKVLVCHVLRYTPFYEKLKEIVASGVLGEIISIDANEGVGTFHQSHSFVRGHWSIVEKSSPMIIAKCCHDMDILSWLVDQPCEQVSSFGSLSYFNKEHTPTDAPPRCTDGCPLGLSCQYNALHYLGKQKGWLKWIYDKTDTATPDEIRAWLAQSPWGRCVYQCDNTAVDHQVISMQFAKNITATFTMTAFNSGRNITICGSRAKLHGGDTTKWQSGADIIVMEHETWHQTRHHIGQDPNDAYGHGGGDSGLVRALHSEMSKDRPGDMRSSISRSVESHLMGFAAETSRLSGKTISIAEFRKLNES
ncbi:MAG: Gfo/Idh/MocA family oxidoreductase [Verrucomicrobiota bacterium]|nr:Gfo/Idh/MocA family oxidoreductase [Verrucomicrobiota bacterium]